MRSARSLEFGYSRCMSRALDRLRTETSLLDENERARLAQDLLESLADQPTSADVEAQWIAEALRRV